MITIDTRLLGAFKNAYGIVPRSPNDFKSVKILDNFIYGMDKYYYIKIPDWIELKQGDFSIIGEMTNLHTLLFKCSDNLNIDDFSFLQKCVKLKRLDVSRTNFADCAILQQLPSLKYARLPEMDRLVNTQVLDTIKARIEIAEPVLNVYNMEEEKMAESEKNIFVSEKVKKLVEAIKEKTRTISYALVIQKDSRPDIFDSKFGGVPYWDKNKEYPQDLEGSKMMLLAQINFDRAEVDERLPQQGMLQFFISNDDLFGADFDKHDVQETFRIVYHESIDYTMTREFVLDMGIPVCTDANIDYTPVFKEAAVNIVRKETYMDEHDIRFSEVFRETVKEQLGEDIGSLSAWNYLDKEEYSYLYDSLTDTGHHMLGYPFFTQYDPRDNADYYDTVLLQIDSEMIDKEDYVLWGDCGVANFFINSEALAKRDFSRVLYNWDCY